jgi:hypothetical protein
MREVSDFVVVLPATMNGASKLVVEAMGERLVRVFPQYNFTFTRSRMMQEDDEFVIVPVMGRAGAGDEGDPDRVYMCKPLEPGVIPHIQDTLRALDQMVLN